jgi:hypothetical protein
VQEVGAVRIDGMSQVEEWADVGRVGVAPQRPGGGPPDRRIAVAQAGYGQRPERLGGRILLAEDPHGVDADETIRIGRGFLEDAVSQGRESVQQPEATDAPGGVAGVGERLASEVVPFGTAATRDLVGRKRLHGEVGIPKVVSRPSASAWVQSARGGVASVCGSSPV